MPQLCPKQEPGRPSAMCTALKSHFCPIDDKVEEKDDEHSKFYVELFCKRIRRNQAGPVYAGPFVL